MGHGSGNGRLRAIVKATKKFRFPYNLGNFLAENQLYLNDSAPWSIV